MANLDDAESLASITQEYHNLTKTVFEKFSQLNDSYEETHQLLQERSRRQRAEIDNLHAFLHERQGQLINKMMRHSRAMERKYREMSSAHSPARAKDNKRFTTPPEEPETEPENEPAPGPQPEPEQEPEPEPEPKKANMPDERPSRTPTKSSSPRNASKERSLPPGNAEQVEEQDIRMDDFVPAVRSPSPAAAQLSATQKESNQASRKPKTFMERAKEIGGIDAGKASKEDAVATNKTSTNKTSMENPVAVTKPKENNNAAASNKAPAYGTAAPVAPMGGSDSRASSERRPVQKARYTGPRRGRGSKRKLDDRVESEVSSSNEPEKIQKVSGQARRHPTRPGLALGARGGPTRAEFAASSNKANSPTTAEAPVFTPVNKTNAGPAKRASALRPATTASSLPTPRLFQADALRATFGGPQRGNFTLLTDAARQVQHVQCDFFLTINPKEHFVVPQRPADPCVLLAIKDLEEPIAADGAFPLFCKLDKKKYLYCGEYRIGERRTITVREWCGLAPEVQKFWKSKMKVSASKRSRQLLVEKGVIGPTDTVNVSPEVIQDLFEASDNEPNLRLEATDLEFVEYKKDTYEILFEQSKKTMEPEEALDDVAPYLDAFIKETGGPENIFPTNILPKKQTLSANGKSSSSVAPARQSAASTSKVPDRKKIPISEQSAEDGAENDIFARDSPSSRRRNTLPTYSIHALGKKTYGKLDSDESSVDDEEPRPSAQQKGKQKKVDFLDISD